MNWKALKKYRTITFNFFWFFIIVILICWLFKLNNRTQIVVDKGYDVPSIQLIVEDKKHLNNELNSLLNQIGSENNKLKKEIEKSLQLEAKFESLDKSIDMISNYIGLFGILITVISIFFSLRESSRIDEYIEKYEEEIEYYRNELSTLDDKIKTHFNAKKIDLDKQINTTVMKALNRFRKEFERKSSNESTPMGKNHNKQSSSNNKYAPNNQKNTENRN